MSLRKQIEGVLTNRPARPIEGSPARYGFHTSTSSGAAKDLPLMSYHYGSSLGQAEASATKH